MTMMMKKKMIRVSVCVFARLSAIRYYRGNNRIVILGLLVVTGDDVIVVL